MERRLPQCIRLPTARASRFALYDLQSDGDDVRKRSVHASRQWESRLQCLRDRWFHRSLSGAIRARRRMSSADREDDAKRPTRAGAQVGRNAVPSPKRSSAAADNPLAHPTRPGTRRRRARTLPTVQEPPGIADGGCAHCGHTRPACPRAGPPPTILALRRTHAYRSARHESASAAGWIAVGRSDRARGRHSVVSSPRVRRAIARGAGAKNTNRAAELTVPCSHLPGSSRVRCGTRAGEHRDATPWVNGYSSPRGKSSGTAAATSPCTLRGHATVPSPWARHEGRRRRHTSAPLSTSSVDTTFTSCAFQPASS